MSTISLQITATDFFPSQASQGLSTYISNSALSTYVSMNLDHQVAHAYTGGHVAYVVPKGPTYDLNHDLVKKGLIRTTPYRPSSTSVTRALSGEADFDIDAQIAAPVQPKYNDLNHCFNIQWKGDVAILPRVTQPSVPGRDRVRGFNGNAIYYMEFVNAVDLDGKMSFYSNGGPNKAHTWTLPENSNVQVDVRPGSSVWRDHVYAMPNHWYYVYRNSSSEEYLSQFNMFRAGMNVFPVGLWYAGQSLHCKDPWYNYDRNREVAHIYGFIYPVTSDPSPSQHSSITRYRVRYLYIGSYLGSSTYVYLYSYYGVRRYPSARAAMQDVTSPDGEWSTLKKSNFSRGTYVRTSYYNTGQAQYDNHIDQVNTDYWMSIYDRFWDPGWSKQIDAAQARVSQTALIGEKVSTGNTALLIEKSFGMGGVIDTYAHLFDYLGVKTRKDLYRTLGVLPSVVKSGVITQADVVKAFGKEANNLFLSSYYGTRLFIRGWKNLIKSIPALIRQLQSEYSYSHARENLTLSSEKFEGKATVNASLAYRFYDQGLIRTLGMLQSIDALPSPRSLWDGVPYSFVADWVLPVGSSLGFYDAVANRYLLQQIRSCYSMRAEIPVVPSVARFNLPIQPVGNSLLVGDSLTLVIYKREYRQTPINPLTSGLDLGLKDLDPSWNLKKTLIGGALLFQRGK